MAINTSPFHHVANLIKQLSINDDSIVINRKIKDVTDDLLALILDDENSIKDAFIYFNEKALVNSNFATNLAFVFSSKSLNLISNSNRFRQEMINVLQNNFMLADEYKTKNIQQFYNSITLLGEYYNRYRICERPVKILGQSLFSLLTKQLLAETDLCLNDSTRTIDLEFCNIIFTQLLLNGSMANEQHKIELQNLLFAIRKCLICVSNLSNNCRAMLLMTIDLSSQNFSQHMETELQIFYKPYLCHVQQIIDQKNNYEDNDSQTTKSPTASANENDTIKQSETIDLKSKLSNGEDTLLSNRQKNYQLRINAEYIGKPLNASARLKLAQTQMQNKCSAEEEKLLKQFETSVEDKNQLDAISSKKSLETVNVCGNNDDNNAVTDCNGSTESNQHMYQNDDARKTMLGVDTTFKIFSIDKNHENNDNSDNHSFRNNKKEKNWPTQSQNSGTKRDGNYRQRGNRRQNRERKNSSSSQQDYHQQQHHPQQPQQSKNNRDDSMPHHPWQNQRGRRGSGNNQHGKITSSSSLNQLEDKRFQIKTPGTTKGPSAATMPNTSSAQQKHRKNDNNDKALFLQKRINEHLNKNNIIPRKKSLSTSVENVATEEIWE